MRPLTVCLITILALPSAAAGQEIVPDTLDWHGYFPLQPGNTWQIYYQNLPFVMPDTKWYVTLTVVGDTVLEGREYHKLSSICVTTAYFEIPGWNRDRCKGVERTFEYFRYDEEAGNIVEYIPGNDPPERLRFRYDFRLDADFGSYVESMYGAYEYFMSDRALVDTETVAATVKHVSVYSAIPTGYSFAHGIGYLGTGGCEGDCWDYRLVYAKIGDRTYGAYRPVGTEQVRDLLREDRLILYPNPIASKARLEFDVSSLANVSVVVYDLLGRSRLITELGPVGPGRQYHEMDFSGLASGTYLAVLRVAEQAVTSERIIVVR